MLISNLVDEYNKHKIVTQSQVSFYDTGIEKQNTIGHNVTDKGWWHSNIYQLMICFSN